MAAGSITTATDGSWITNPDTGSVLVADDSGCPPYALTPCTEGTGTTGLGLPDDKNPDNAVPGDIVLNGDDGFCYTVGCRACGLTPVTSNASKQTGCDAAACTSNELPQLSPCSCGEPALGLRPEDTPVGATVGSVVLYMGYCYTIAGSASGLTPTTEAATLEDACDSDDCPDDPIPTQYAIDFDVKYEFICTGNESNNFSFTAHASDVLTRDGTSGTVRYVNGSIDADGILFSAEVQGTCGTGWLMDISTLFADAEDDCITDVENHGLISFTLPAGLPVGTYTETSSAILKFEATCEEDCDEGTCSEGCSSFEYKVTITNVVVS